MALNIDIERAEQIIAYHFRNRDRLREALQAATRIQQEATGETLERHDGNRRLAQLGHKVVELVLLDIWYGTGADRGKCNGNMQHIVWLTHTTEEANNILGRVARNDFLADIAQQSGLDACIVPSVRQQTQIIPPATLKLVLTAVIGGVWLDSGKSIAVTMDVMRNLRQVKLLSCSSPFTYRSSGSAKLGNARILSQRRGR
jgi:ribonuclease-3